MREVPGGASAWLPFLPMDIPSGNTLPDIAHCELLEGLKSLGNDTAVRIQAQGQGEGFEIAKVQSGLVINGGEPGVLYGVYSLLSSLARNEDPVTPYTEPHYPLRMLNHWDNMDGTVERGYAGSSFFFKDHQIQFDEARIHRYARMLASVGINAICPSNVNVRPPMDLLITERFLPDLARLAGILRLYGIRLLLTIEFSMPSSHEPGTADPLDPAVQAWWKGRTAEVYKWVPDLVGFLVKADSEHRPGPFTYKRTHAQGANTLAQALAPYGGTLFWRCFVYNCRQDWRDHITDRLRAPYDHYAPLDGRFDPNVVLQIKNGPLDFQVREPVSPLFFSMPRTQKALEVQLTQEYTGQQTDLFYQAGQWQDVLSLLPDQAVRSITAVSNLGSNGNWCGHDLAQANLYAYGRTAWLGISDPPRFAREFSLLCFPRAAEQVSGILTASAPAYEKYTAPLGLGFMVVPNTHYGPSPEGYEFSHWGTYHRADREAIGIDRSTGGTGLTAQYPKNLLTQYDDPARCPENLLLFFHRVRYDARLSDGRTLLQRIYDDHFEGAEEAARLKEQWMRLKESVSSDVYERVLERFEKQLCNAREWRDVLNTYFFRRTGIPDDKGRLIHP